MALSNNPELFLGIEGGATHTVGLVIEPNGKIVARAEVGPCNLRLLTDAALVRQLRALKARLPTPAALCAGLAGLRSESDRQRVLTALARVWPGVPNRACSDLETALAAVGPAEVPFEAQVLILSGTGSCCFGQVPSGQTAKIGGWGHLLGDKGSAYDISLRALKAVVYYFDRDRVWPELGARFLRSLQLNQPDDLIAWVQAAEKKDVAALAVDVFEAWARRDSIASDILIAAGEGLAKDAVACARALVSTGARVQFVLAGSVLLKQPKFARRLALQLGKLWPNSVVAALTAEGAWGAASLAQNASRSVDRIPAPGSRRSPSDSTPSGRVWRESILPQATDISPTERRNRHSMHLDRMPVRRAVQLMFREEETVSRRLLKHEKQIAACIALIAQALRRGGRLFYVGAGTSGRLGVLDASECPPTFRTAREQVQGIMAGGARALWQSIEGAEDDADAGAAAVRFRQITSRDVVVGIAASGRTPFVWGALDEAKRRGAKSILVTFNPHLRIAKMSRPNQVLAVDLGPEILTGSTRLKAGTATKLILNAFTTLTMVQLGKVISNLMVDLNPSNVKLRARAIRIVQELTGVDETDAMSALEKCGWVIKSAWRSLRSRAFPKVSRRKKVSKPRTSRSASPSR